MVAWAAKAAGLQVIDSIFLTRTTWTAPGRDRAGQTPRLYRQSLVNPRQIEVVHEVFRPKPEEVAHALEVMEAIQRHARWARGHLAAGQDGRRPVVKRAARTIKTAVAFGMIEYELTDEVIHGAK